MLNLLMELSQAATVAIAGHVRPDGDCVGSCMGLWLYIRDNFPKIRADVYLDPIPEAYCFIEGTDQILHSCEAAGAYDLFIALDAGDTERLGENAALLRKAKRTICIDHHVSNRGFAAENYIVPEASSTSELIFTLLDEEKVGKACAEALYMGIAHDTGVFLFPCTSSQTMCIAGKLMEKGIDFTRILDDTYYKKTYLQNQILGRALLESISLMGGKIVFSAIKLKDMDFYGVTSADLDGIVQQLRNTKGVEVAIFLYETGIQEFKVSMRSNSVVDVSVVAGYFGGGGHVRAAGCTMQGSIYDVVNNLTKHIEKQMIAAGMQETEE